MTESKVDIRRMEVRELAESMLRDPRFAETPAYLKRELYPDAAFLGTNYDTYLLMKWGR